MPIPDVPRSRIDDAILEFDRELRDSTEMQGWEQRGYQKYAISLNENLYPPKKIVSMATGVPVSRFNAQEARRYLKRHNFETKEIPEVTPSLEKISAVDCETLQRHRAQQTRWADLPEQDLAALVKVHQLLNQVVARVLRDSGGSDLFDLISTSGFTPASGVRGSLPKDLWVSLINKGSERYKGMPQIYVIFSEHGVELGFAAAVHPSNFSNQELKQALRDIAPELFGGLPDSDGGTVLGIQQLLDEFGGWCYRDRTRAVPNHSEFDSLADLIDDLNSPGGHQRTSGAICRYFSPEEIGQPGFNLEREFAQAVDIFAPLMWETAVNLGIAEGETPPAIPTAEERIQSLLKQVMVLYPDVSSRPFKTDRELWSLFSSICHTLQVSPPVRNRPNIKVTWSVGRGNWAKVPWIALLDQRETTTTQQGVYGVFLFAQDMSGVYTTFNQGVTQPKRDRGAAGGREWVQVNAKYLRRYCDPLPELGFYLDNAIDLRADPGLGQDYESSTVAYKLYSHDKVPDDTTILRDLEGVLVAYDRYLENRETDPTAPSITETHEPPEGQRVWLIAPGPNADHWDEFYQAGIIAIGWDELGDLSELESLETTKEKLIDVYESETEPVNNALACYEFAHVMRPGDLVLAKKGQHSIVGYGMVTGDYVFDDTRPIYKHVRTIRWEARGNWNYEGKLVLKTVTDITKYPQHVEDLKRLVGLVVEEEPETTPEAERSPYSVDDAITGLFMPKDEFEEILNLWKHKKNLIIQGPPGVGKTFIAKRLAYTLMGYRDPSRFGMVQFHQSYSYEDFIQGYRPSGEGFTLKNGLFYSFCKRALRDQDNRFVFAIDEINRGNLSKIFGELLMLIEPDKRGTEWSVPLTYARSSQDQFYVPENLYLLGLMNTADRSLAVVDYALRRRFAFVNLYPRFTSDVFRAHHAEVGVPSAMTNKIIERMNELNEAIAEDRVNLGEGFQIGHSFFTPAAENGPFDDAWYRRVMLNEIIPLLKEYWFDDPDIADQWRDRLLA